MVIVDPRADNGTEQATALELPSPRTADGEASRDEATVQLPAGVVPEIAPLALAGMRRDEAPPTGPSGVVESAADALRTEEVERTRLFIRMGWALSLAVIATFPFVDAPRVMSIVWGSTLVAAGVLSFRLHQAFADPRRYTERALLLLGLVCMFNGQLGVLYYGTFTAAPLMIAVGIHFVARTEAERVARWIFVGGMTCYAASASLIIAGAIDDPGVFASDRPIAPGTLVAATVFVLGAFWLAYGTARMFRSVSLAAIEDLRHATRLASQREAMMNELRGELERALHVGGPGRYTDHVIGSYRLGVLLGRGAMGEVYSATHVADGTPAAVKLLRRELLTDPTHVARFLREARATGALDSPHVARVLDASATELPYLALERLDGRTLGEILRADGRLDPAATIELVQQCGAGVDAAIAVGVVHRDLKPQNLMLCEDGTWKILDFGVASIADEAGLLTHGEVVGTPHYMAPEQAEGTRVDGRADTYALAAIAYRCLTGQHPFQAPDTPALLYAVVHRVPARPGALAELPADIDRWCALALAKQPDDRFQTGAELAAALAAAARDALDPRLRRRADALIRKHPWEST